MIQRIQSVYLLGAVLVLAAAALILFQMPESVLEGLRMAFVAAVVATGLGGLVSIFLYGSRELQRTVVRTFGLIDLLVVLALVVVLYLTGDLPYLYSEAPASFLGLLILLLFSIALFHRAAKAVKRDIDLIRSMDRLR
jgi:hypothetical protein